MNDQVKTKEQLITELQQLRKEVAELKAREHHEAKKTPNAQAQVKVSLSWDDSPVEQYEALFAQIISSAESSIFCLDITTGHFTVSASAKTSHGVHPDVFVGHEAAMSTVHPDDLPRVKAAWKNCVERGERYVMEYRVLQPDGSVRWIASEAQVLPGPRGPKFVGACRDVTKRKQAEERLLASEQRYRLLFEAMTEGFVLAEILVDERGMPVDYWVLEANPAAAKLTGISAQAAIGKTARELMPDIRTDWIDAFGKVALTREPTSFERYSRSLKKWFHIVAYSPEQGKFACLFVDITERKHSEAALADLSSEWQITFDAISDSIAVLNPDFSIVRCNRATAELLDMPLEEIVGCKCFELVHGTPEPLSTCPVWHIIETGSRGTGILQCGSRWIEVTAEPVRIKDGTLKKIVHIIRDITERKQAEEELRYHGEQFKTLLNEAPLGVYLVDADFRFAQMNPIALAVFGGVPDLIGRDFDEVIHLVWERDYADEAVRIFRHTLQSGEPYHMPERPEFWTDRKVVEYCEWWVSRITLPDGRYGVVCYFRDVSEQIKARQIIAASEERYRTLFERIDEGFCIQQVIFDEAGKPIDYRFLEINPAFEKQTGIKDALGKTIRELVPDIEPFWFEIYGNLILIGEPVRFEHHAKSMDRWFDVYAFCVGEPQEHKVAVLFNDITERKQAEEALQRLNAELEQRVEEQTSALRKSESQLRLLSSKNSGDSMCN